MSGRICASTVLAVFAGLSVAISTASAQQPTRLRGEIEKIDGATITMKAGERGDVKIELGDKPQVLGLVKSKLSDIKPNSFIGVGAMPQADGSQKAIQVTIFMEAQRGVGEGHRPWDRPGSTMTNGAVDTTVSSVDGQMLTVKYKDGEKKILITPQSTIQAYVPGDRSELKPGAHIVVFAAKKPDGSFEASRVTVGRDGVVP
jgi:hypothetical protein